VQGFHGDDALPAFLEGLDTLVCLLPLTPATRGILGRATFDRLPRGATLVHVGRGEHLVPADLQAALADGHLRGAVVDVFAREPLPPDDALWATPGLVVTPHMATLATLSSIGGQIVANVERLVRGEPLANRVDVAGYATA
nr:glyoxylate/hydroxypyruvate reductase A [Burkholderiaceae bacterium]